MDVETLRDLCLSMPAATEDVPFPSYPDIVAWRVGGKVFAMLDLEDTAWFVLKCDPDRAVELRRMHEEIRPAWHMNKRHWNQVDIAGTLPRATIEELVRHSHALVMAKLPRKIRLTINDEKAHT